MQLKIPVKKDNLIDRSRRDINMRDIKYSEPAVLLKMCVGGKWGTYPRAGGVSSYGP